MKEYYYQIQIDKPYVFKTEVKLETEEDIVSFALDEGVLDPDDGDPYAALDWADEITKEQYDYCKWQDDAQ